VGEFRQECQGEAVPQTMTAAELQGTDLQLLSADAQQLQLLLQAAHQTLLATAAQVICHLPGAAT